MQLSYRVYRIIAISKNDRTIIIPALKDTISVTGDNFSESYIEQMTLFYIEMLLDLDSIFYGLLANIFKFRLLNYISEDDEASKPEAYAFQ